MKRLITFCLILALLMTDYLLRPAAASSSPAAARVALIGRLGGASLAVAAHGAYAFVGQSAEFTVLDMTDRTQPRRVAYLPLAANDIALDGGYAYATNKHGLVAIDIARPSAPAEVGFLALPHALSALAVGNGLVYAVAPGTGLYIIDGAEPKRLVQIGFLRVPQIEGVAVLDDNVYLATAQGLKVISVSDPRHPALVGAINAPAYAEAVAVTGQYAYLTAALGSLTIVDIADPTHPTLVGAIRIPGFTKNLQVTGAVVYIASGNRGVSVIDVGNRHQPRLLGVSKVGALVTDVAVAGHALLATDVSDGGMYILDAGYPAQLNAVGLYRAPGTALDTASTGDYVYVAAGLEGDIITVVQADPAHLAGVGFYRTPGVTSAVQVNNNRLFAYGAQTGLQVLDLSDPMQPVELGSYDLVENGRIVAMQGGMSFVSDQASALHAFDAFLTGIPRKVGLFPITGRVLDAAISRNFLLIAGGMDGATIINHADRTEAASVVVSGNVQLVDATREYGYVLSGEGDLSVLDLSADGAARLMGQIALGAAPRALSVHGRYALVAAGEDGVFIVDVADPTRPVIVAVYDTPGVALNAEMVGHRILVADGYAGLLILTVAGDGKAGSVARKLSAVLCTSTRGRK